MDMLEVVEIMKSKIGKIEFGSVEVRALVRGGHVIRFEVSENQSVLVEDKRKTDRRGDSG